MRPARVRVCEHDPTTPIRAIWVPSRLGPHARPQSKLHGWVLVCWFGGFMVSWLLGLLASWFPALVAPGLSAPWLEGRTRAGDKGTE